MADRIPFDLSEHTRHAQPGGVPCSLHLGAEPPSVYREYAPLPGLRPYLICAWTLEIRAGDRPHRQRVLPDGCSDIVWLGEALPIVVGPMTQSALFTSPAGTTLVGLRFRPEVAERVFGVPAHELADRHVLLDRLWNRQAVTETSERLLERRTTAGQVAVAQAFLASRRHAIASPAPLIQRAMSLLVAARQDRIERVAKSIGISERHLHRSFLASVGYSPKLFQRILRFQRLLTLAKVDSSTRLGHLALSAGYADQAHMTREVGEFAGVTPSAVLGNVVSALTLSELLGVPQPLYSS